MKHYQTYYEPKQLLAHSQQKMMPNPNYTLTTKQIRPSSSHPYSRKATQNEQSTSQLTKSQIISASTHQKPSSPDNKVLHDKFLSPYDQSRIASVSVKQLSSSTIIKPKSNVSIPFLPDKSKKNSNKKTLILDLDETLVHSSFKPFPFKPDICLRIGVDNKEHIVNVLKRPYAEEFLIRMSKCFELVIFTASVSPYANPLLDKLDHHKVISHRLFREHCVNVSGLYIKDLKKVGRNLKDTIILDNNPISYVVNKENGLPILTWNFDKNDTELLKIIPFLEYLSKVNDVRPVIKKVVINNTINLREMTNDINTTINSNSKNQRAYSSMSSHQSKLTESQEKKHKNNHIQNSNFNQSINPSNSQDNNKKSININIVNHHVSNVYLSDYHQEENARNLLIVKKKSNSNNGNVNTTSPSNLNATNVQKVTNQPSFNSSAIIVKPVFNNDKDIHNNYLFKSSNRLSEPVSLLIDSNARNSLIRSNTNYYDNLNQMSSKSLSLVHHNQNPLANKKDQKYLALNHTNNIMPHPYIVKELSVSSNNYYSSMRQINDINNNDREYYSRFNNFTNQNASQFNYRPKSSLLKNNNKKNDYIDSGFNTNYSPSFSISQFQHYSSKHRDLERERELKEQSINPSSYLYPNNQQNLSYYLQERENNLRFGSSAYTNERPSFSNDYLMQNGPQYDSPYHIDPKNQLARNFSLSNRDRYYQGVNNVIFNS